MLCHDHMCWYAAVPILHTHTHAPAYPAADDEGPGHGAAAVRGPARGGKGAVCMLCDRKDPPLVALGFGGLVVGGKKGTQVPVVVYRWPYPLTCVCPLAAAAEGQPASGGRAGGVSLGPRIGPPWLHSSNQEVPLGGALWPSRLLRDYGGASKGMVHQMMPSQ
jgi:hypothetical protein